MCAINTYISTGHNIIYCSICIIENSCTNLIRCYLISVLIRNAYSLISGLIHILGHSIRMVTIHLRLRALDIISLLFSFGGFVDDLVEVAVGFYGRGLSGSICLGDSYCAVGSGSNLEGISFVYSHTGHIGAVDGCSYGDIADGYSGCVDHVTLVVLNGTFAAIDDLGFDPGLDALSHIPVIGSDSCLLGSCGFFVRSPGTGIIRILIVTLCGGLCIICNGRSDLVTLGILDRITLGINKSGFLRRAVLDHCRL